jgi:hypothetical protein
MHIGFEYGYDNQSRVAIDNRFFSELYKNGIRNDPRLLIIFATCNLAF